MIANAGNAMGQEISPIDDAPEGFYILWIVQELDSEKITTKVGGYYETFVDAAWDLAEWCDNTDDGWQVIEATIKPKDRLTFEELKLWFSE